MINISFSVRLGVHASGINKIGFFLANLNFHPIRRAMRFSVGSNPPTTCCDGCSTSMNVGEILAFLITLKSCG